MNVRRGRHLGPAIALVVGVVAPIAACGDGDDDPRMGRSAPGVDTTWHWQLQGDIDTGHEVDLYDVDLFEAPDDVLDELRSVGRTVICYVSAGSSERWRPDADEFAPADLGVAMDGWDDEHWLDIRSDRVRSVMESRLDLAVDRGCDGVEPDNVDGYTNETGFDLTPADQLDFNRFLASAARERGLLVGLKNSGDQVPALVDLFDFAVVEQCHEYDECDRYAPFLDQGKPVFVAEYAQRFVDDPTPVCAASSRLGLRTIVVPLDHDGSFRIDCG